MTHARRGFPRDVKFSGASGVAVTHARGGSSELSSLVGLGTVTHTGAPHGLMISMSFYLSGEYLHFNSNFRAIYKGSYDTNVLGLEYWLLMLLTFHSNS